MAAISSLVDDEMKGCLIELEQKINQLIDIISKLEISSVQA